MRTTLRTALIYLVGLINIASTLLPIWPKRYLLLTSLFPIQLALAAQHLTLFAGVLMLLLAYPAANGHKRSAWALMICALLASIMNVAKGLDVEEALVNLGLLAALWMARKRFHSIPLRYTVVDLARLGVALLVIQRLSRVAIARTQTMLANENFVTRAKPEVVQKERDALAAGEDTLARLEAQRRELAG